MSTTIALAVLLAVTVVVVLVLRATGQALRHATEQGGALKQAADSLQQELRQFKEGGFDALVREKLVLLQQAAEARDRALEQQQHEATEALLRAKTDLGTITEKIKSLSELQDKVGQLNDLLKPQQFRGALGEVIVRSLIADKLPAGQFDEDHVFASGKRVEFVIRWHDRLIPVDSKLQLDAFKRMRDASDERQRHACRTEFKREIKHKIDEVHEYIRPSEGTHNFAFMVIPSEAVYYEVIGHKDFLDESGIFEYAKAKNVHVVSPMTFWAYLTVLADGLRGQEIGRRAEEILAGLQAISARFHRFSQGEFRLVGQHLRNAQAQYEEALRRLRDVEDSLSSLERTQIHGADIPAALPPRPASLTGGPTHD